MKILPEKEFRELAKSQGYTYVETLAGFIDKYTHEPVVIEDAEPRTILHELGHVKAGHLSRAIEFYGKGRKNPLIIRQPMTSRVDEEIEAELYRFEVEGKRITPRVGLMAIVELLDGGWRPDRAISLVIGRMKNYGIETSWKERQDLIDILEREHWDLGNRELL